MNAVIKISSKDNDNIKEISNLQKSPKKRREARLFVLEGLRLCNDAIENGFIPVKIFCSSSDIEKYSDIIDKFISKCEVFEVSDNLFSKISDTVNPQGILCTFKLPANDTCALKPNGKYIALENIQDPSNLGAISRTAEAFAIDGLIIKDGCDPFSSKSVRASMGALLRIPIIETENFFDLFSKYGLKSYASVVTKNAKAINSMSFKNGSVVIIGNEANGVSNETLNSCNECFTIPMDGKAESLNAAVAASIIIWEMCKC